MLTSTERIKNRGCTKKREPSHPEVRVVLIGVGAIGCEIARLLLKKRGVKIVGAVDPTPDKAGRDLGEIVGLEKNLRGNNPQRHRKRKWGISLT